jgi:NADPH:quinone reductase-like Zn-dependent oxidoreductase
MLSPRYENVRRLRLGFCPGLERPTVEGRLAQQRSLVKAAVYTRYGPPDVVQITDVEQMVPKDDEVLIRVRAASVNPYDWHYMRGTPYFLRIGAGLLKPKSTRLGVDVAGQVETVGSKVTGFKPGDKVFGTCRGAFAEYACASEPSFAIKPGNVSFEQAASLPIAGLTALQSLRDRGHTQSGQKVLINGAAGGVGTFAVQIAKSLGAEVSAVCSTRNVDMVRSLGADRTIDYTREDFTRSGQRYDLIFDLVANHSLSACRRVLNPEGIYLVAGVGPGKSVYILLARAIAGPLLGVFVPQRFSVFGAKLRKVDLIILGELMRAGKVRPVIDRVYRLTEVPEAIRYLEGGHARGKVVIAVS